MPSPAADDPKSQHSVLETIAHRTGAAPRVLLPDSASGHGTSPVVNPGAAAAKLVPQGRGNYQLLGEIARGGMGVILKGHDTDLGRDVAVKVLDAALAKRPEVVQRFVEEAQIGGQLQHPGIVPVYELGLMADERPYFTMKLVKGRTLAALLAQRSSPSEDRGRVLAIFEAVCQTMAYAHSKGVLHRDLKPANIMLGAFGEVQVVDWGLAKVLHRGGVADEKRAVERSTLMTVIETVRSGPGSGSDSLSGSVMGTPTYMAPEQAQGEVETLDERADVFSLGAILCEIMTGKPLYEHREDEPIVVQAAHAMLEPARARIEACDADPALKKLCLGCLMPARAARPANAEAVAKAIHAFLTSVEERAQKAELASAEARVKAAEERRARRLTLALAGAVVAAVVLGGGGLWWAGRERAKRAEQTRTAVEDAWSESARLAQAGKMAEALASARRAQSLVDAGDADAALLERARTFVTKAEADVGAAASEHALALQDETLRSRLIDLRLEQIAAINDPDRAAAVDGKFAQAFRDYGVDLEGDDIVPAMRRIRERSIAEEVALALDDWTHLRRQVQGSRSEKVENLFNLAMDLDPDPTRMRMRQAIAQDELPAMLELASPDRLPSLGPGSIFALCVALWDGHEDQHEAVHRILDQGCHLYPGDFVLQSLTGLYDQFDNRYAAAVSRRATAAGLRPGDLVARTYLGESLLFLGRITEAEAAAHAALAIDASYRDGLYLLGMCRHHLGDHEGELASFAKSPAIEANADMRSDVLVARFETGRMTRDAIEAEASGENVPGRVMGYLIALVSHPDPAQRDPDFVLRTFKEQEATIGTWRARWIVEALARIELQDWAGAQAALEHHYPKPFFLVMVSPGYEFVRSLIYSHVGRADEARTAWERGQVEWDELTVADPQAWEHCDAMRWRREAEAALAR